MSVATVRFPIDGMICTSCVAHIARAVRKLPGIERVKVDLATGSALVAYDAELATLDGIAAAIERAGYGAQMAEARVEQPAPARESGSLLTRLKLRRSPDA